MKPEVVRGGHIGVTTCQVAPIDRHMLNGKHRRNLALTFNVYRSGAYNCEILNGNRPLRGFLTLDAGGFLTLQQFARDFIDLKRWLLASMKVQYIYLLFFSRQLLRCSDKKRLSRKTFKKDSRSHTYSIKWYGLKCDLPKHFCWLAFLLWNKESYYYFVWSLWPPVNL